MSLRSRSIVETPIAVIDLETTGLSPLGDRIVEIAVVRIDPGQAPRVVLDTLVNPQRRVTGSSIHGIYDDDVVGAPLFGELVGPIAEAIDGAAVAAFNVYFDMKFLESELAMAQVPAAFPHLCLMWLRPVLGLGARANLSATCSAMGIPMGAAHSAAADAMASAQLWLHYLRAAEARELRTFDDVASLRHYKFMNSWDWETLSRSQYADRRLGTALKPRKLRTPAEDKAAAVAEYRRENAVAEYWDVITSAIADGEFSRAEISLLLRTQEALDLPADALRYVHGRVMAGLLDEMTMDRRVDDKEVRWLAEVTWMLRDLGWAPGDAIKEPN